MHRNLLLSILLVLLVLASSSAWALLAEGSVAPDIRYKDIDTSEELWLYDEYQGAIVVIEMFATW